MEHTSNQLRLNDYGPFTIPEKDYWVIVGSGPTAERIYDFVDANKNVGIISLNAELPGVPYSTIHMIGHYEYYLQCIHDLAKPEILFIANPLAVGYRCVDALAINLFDFAYFEENFPWKIRFFEKEKDINKLHLRSHSLYCHDTMASTALHLLFRNGVKKAYYCGIDGHDLSVKEGRSWMFEKEYRVRKPNARVAVERRYDIELDHFKEFAQECGIELRTLKDVVFSHKKPASHPKEAVCQS